MRRALLLCALVGALACERTPEPQEPAAVTSPAAPEVIQQEASAGDEPSPGELDFVHRGLVALVPSGGKATAVFLSPEGHPHEPRLAVNARWIHPTNTSVPDLVVPIAGGDGMAIWQFTSAELDLGNVDPSNTLRLHDTGFPGDFTAIQWVPRMQDIFGTPQEVDLDAIAAAAARAPWSHGTVTAVFDPTVDSRDHKTEKWTIGQRDSQAVADAFRVRIRMKASAAPVKLKVTRDGRPEVIPLKEKAVVFLSAYPRNVHGQDMEHFRHFYSLRMNRDPGPSPIKITTPPVFNPARCAPVVFP